MKLHLLVIMTVFLFTGCQANKDESHEGKEVAMYNSAPMLPSEVTIQEASIDLNMPKKPEQGRADVAQVTKAPSKIIRNAAVEFQVKNTDESHERIKSLLAKHNGYFGNDNSSTSSYRKDHNMIIRVPAKSFDALLADVMQESIYTNYKNISAEDVTDQFVDAEARLKTKKQVEQRYLAILKDAKKVQDILDIEDKLRVIREEIEATEGKLKLLNDQVDYSTINLNIYQNLDYVAQPETGFINSLKEAFINGWRNLVDFFVGIIRLWPFLIIIAISITLVIRRIRRKRLI
jgi:hypothetical protein